MVRDFEKEIAGNFRRGGFRFVSPKSEWIKEHLLDVGRDYPRRMFERFREFVEVLEVDFDPGEYGDFNNHLYRLRELDLVEVVEREPRKDQPGNPDWGRAMHSVVEENIESEKWDAPTRYLYPYASRSWIREQLEEGLTPGEVAAKAEEVSPRDIEVSEEQIQEKIEVWSLRHLL